MSASSRSHLTIDDHGILSLLTSGLREVMDYWSSEEAWKPVVSSVARGGEEGNAAAQALRRALDDDNTSQDQRRVIGSAAFNWWMNSSTDQINNAPVFLLRLARDEALLRKNSDAARDLDAVVRGKFPPGVLDSDDAPLDPKRPILQEEMNQSTSVLCRRGVAVDQGVGSYVFNTDPLRGEELWKMQQELATGDYGLICGALLRRPEDFLDDLDEGAAFLKHVSELACLKSYPACLGEVKRKAGVLESLCGQRKTEFTGDDVYTALVQGDAATLQNLNKNIARLTKGGNTEIDPEKMRNWVFGSDVMSHSSAIFAMLQDASKNCGKKDMKPAFLGYLELVDAVAKKFGPETRRYWLEGFKSFEKSPQFESFKKVLGSDFAKRYKPLMAALASSVFR